MKTEKELIDLVDKIIESNLYTVNMTTTKLATLIVKSINSTRRSERRADGSNKQTQEVCIGYGYSIKGKYSYCRDCGKILSKPSGCVG